MVYLFLNSGSPVLTTPSFNQEIDESIPFIRSEIEDLYDANSTKDAADICLRVMERAAPVLKSDMINEYFHLPGREQNFRTTRRF